MASGNNTWASGITGDTIPRVSLNSDGYILWGTGSATSDLRLARSAAKTLRLDDNAGGAATFNMNNGSITNAVISTGSTINLTSSTGMVAQTAATTYSARTLGVGSAKLTVADGSGVAGNPTLDLGSITGSTGMVAQTGAGTYSARTITAGTGITIADGSGVAGNPTISLTSGSTTIQYARVSVSVADMTGFTGAAGTGKAILPALAAGQYYVIQNVALIKRGNGAGTRVYANGSELGLFYEDSISQPATWVDNSGLAVNSGGGGLPDLSGTPISFAPNPLGGTNLLTDQALYLNIISGGGAFTLAGAGTATDFYLDIYYTTLSY